MPNGFGHYAIGLMYQDGSIQMMKIWFKLISLKAEGIWNSDRILMYSEKRSVYWLTRNTDSMDSFCEAIDCLSLSSFEKSIETLKILLKGMCFCINNGTFSIIFITFNPLKHKLNYFDIWDVFVESNETFGSHILGSLKQTLNLRNCFSNVICLVLIKKIETKMH